MRCFVACFLRPESAAALAGEVPAIAGARPVPAENLHVTLRFLGEVPAEDLDRVLASVAALAGEPTSARAQALTGFPTRTRARSVVAPLDVSERLHAWHAMLARAWPGDDRPLLPHVTLARSRAGVVVPDLPERSGLTIELAPPAAYRSHTLPSGARYSRLAKDDANPHR